MPTIKAFKCRSVISSLHVILILKLDYSATTEHARTNLTAYTKRLV